MFFFGVRKITMQSHLVSILVLSAPLFSCAFHTSFSVTQQRNCFSQCTPSRPNFLSTYQSRRLEPIRCKAIKRHRDSKEVIERQKVLTDAMNLLSNWDEEQADFTLTHTNNNAPLGDWRGLRRQLTEEERNDMRNACKVLCEDAAYVLLGLNAESEEEAICAYQEWLEGLDLPVPDEIPYMDDISGIEYRSVDEMPQDFASLVKGAVHIAYNSKAGADPVTGDDSNAPAKAHIMPYPAPDRGVVFTPILEGFFTQYGDVPLDLFSKERLEVRQERYKYKKQSTEDLAAKQHAMIGNVQAVEYLLRNQESKQGSAAAE